MTSDTSDGEKKMNLLAGWTDGKVIHTDVKFKSQSGWYDHTTYNTEISLGTPFERLRSMSAQYDLSIKPDVWEDKLLFELNGDQLLEFKGDILTKDRFQRSVTFTKPWPMYYAAGGSMTDTKMEADLTANWNKEVERNNIHVSLSTTDDSDETKTTKTAEIRLDAFLKKMGLRYLKEANGLSLVSNGEVFWGTGEVEKIFYDLKIDESTRRDKTMSDTHLKFGLPTRTLEFHSSLSDSKLSRTCDATFMWDAKRDSTKHVGLKAMVTKGDLMRADVTLSMPSIDKEIHVDGELMLNNGHRIILDSKTDISYSKDTRKTLTLTSKVLDLADSYSHYNYSMELGLKHPYTNIDMKMNSHIGSSDKSMTMGLMTYYLTARKQDKNLALLAEINKIKKAISVQMFSPMNKMEIVGRVLSENPHKLKLVNKIDDSELFRSYLVLDAEEKFAEVNTIIDKETFTITAKYPSTKDFEAYIKHSTPDEKRRQALLALHLNTTRLLHSRMAWEPEMWTDLTTELVEKAAVATVKATEKFTLINHAIADEIEGKHRAVASHMKEELMPLVDMLERKFIDIAYDMVDTVRQMRELYTQNYMNIQDMADTYRTIETYYNMQITEYRRWYGELISTLRQGLTDMEEYPAREKYLDFVRTTTAKLGIRLASIIDRLGGTLMQKLSMYESWTKQMAYSIHDMYQDKMNYAKEKWEDMTDVEIMPYITSIKLPEEYSNTIDSVRSRTQSGLMYIWERPEMDPYRGNTNSIYQQGKWAANYWDIKTNMKNSLIRIMNLMKEIIDEELQEMHSECSLFYKLKNGVIWPVKTTYWAPKQAELQAEVILPLDVHRLDEVPDIGPLKEDLKKFASDVAVYLPDHTTWESIRMKISKMLPTPADKPADNPEDMKKYTPTRKFRGKRKAGKKGKKMRS